MAPSRRALLLAAGLAPWAGAARALPARTLAFPRDHGAHPDLRTEWWYLTGHVQAEGGRAFGFQVTFFRSRIESAQAMASRFAARQLIFAHAAVTDLQGRKLWHDQRIARAGFGIAQAAEDDTALTLRDWTLAREATGAYRTQVAAAGFALALACTPTQPLLLQGVAGLSRKGPELAQASYYYSQPQLRTTGTLAVQGRRFAVQGRAWLDHEWSQALLHPQAVGWDWIGINLADGGALTAFQLRRADGSALWHGGSWRGAGDGAAARRFGPDTVRFEALAHWTSPATGTRYPVRWRIHTPVGEFTVQALLDAQELDSRGSTGAVYWEGLSRLLDAAGRELGHGYLELTGYHAPLRLG